MWSRVGWGRYPTSRPSYIQLSFQSLPLTRLNGKPETNRALEATAPRAQSKL